MGRKEGILPHKVRSQVRLTLAGATVRILYRLPSGPQSFFTYTLTQAQSPSYIQIPRRQSTQPVLGTQEIGFKEGGTRNSRKSDREGMGGGDTSRWKNRGNHKESG